MSFLVPYFSSEISKECTNLNRFNSSLDSKNSLVLKPMEGTVIKLPGKRLILPKMSSTSKTNSMSLKNVSKPEISKSCLNNSKGKVLVRIADPGISNSTKKLLPVKPKNVLSHVQDITQQQIVIVDANSISQSQDLIADAELKNLVPARNQLAFHPVVANNILGAEKAITDETYCTNTETDTIEHYIDTDSHQGLKLQPGRQLMNSNPFLSDLDSLELINDIDSFNKVSTQEDPEKDKVIAEAYLPVADNNIELKMDHDISFSWNADSLLNCEVPMSDDPMNPMTMVNPMEAEGKKFVNEDIEIESAANCSNEMENQVLPIQQSATDAVVSDKDMEEAVQNIDDEWIDSILKDIEVIPENNTTQNDVPVAEENDLLRMVMDDSIGMDTMAQICQTLPDCSTVNLQDIRLANENKVPPSPAAGTTEEVLDIVETVPVLTPSRRGPGRPKKPRTTERVVRPRGRPARIHTSSENTNEHHNYSNDRVTSMSTAERRYRRMRDLNNIASQRCRLKRKSKMQHALDELKEVEDKNKELVIKNRLLEEQVRIIKKAFIQRIANPQKRAIAAPSPDTVWNMEQLERFVNAAASQHLEQE